MQHLQTSGPKVQIPAAYVQHPLPAATLDAPQIGRQQCTLCVLPVIAQDCLNDRHVKTAGRARLVKVGGEPVHDHIEGVVEREVVDEDCPDGRVPQKAPPGSGGRPALPDRPAPA